MCLICFRNSGNEMFRDFLDDTKHHTGLCERPGVKGNISLFYLGHSKITQSHDKDWSETNLGRDAKQHGGFDLVTSRVQMVIVFYPKAAIFSPTQVPWGKSRTFYKQQRLEMLLTSRRFSGTRRGSQGSKGIWVLPETV